MATTFLSDLMQYPRLLQMLLVLGMGGNLLVGFQVSVITYPSQDIKNFINETWIDRYSAPLHHETLTLLWSTIVSVYCVGGLLGCLWSGSLTRRFGKKKTFLCNDMIIIAAALLIGFSKVARSFEMILLGRFFYGISAGVSLNIHGLYLGEVSPKKLRGFVVTTSAVSLSLGKALGQIMALRFQAASPCSISTYKGLIMSEGWEAPGERLLTRGDKRHRPRDLIGSRWPLLLALCGVAALMQLLLLPFFPESPSYLLIQKEDKEGCLKAMKYLWGEGLHQAEMEDLMKEKAATKNSKNLGVLDLLKEQSLRKPLYVTVLLILTLQLCGLTAIYFYTVEVFRTAKLEEALIPYVALGLGASEFVSVVLCSSIIDRFGRKILLWGGFGLMAVVMALLIVTLSLQAHVPWMSYCSIALIFLFVIFYGLGPSGAIFAIMLEIFNQSARASAFIIAGIISWVGFLMNGMGFPFVVEAIGHFCFIFFLAVLVGAAVFIYVVLPETKGKSITDITEELSRIRLGRKRTQEENSPVKDHSSCTKL